MSFDVADTFCTEGLVTSGVVDLVWGCGWRAPTYESMRSAEGGCFVGVHNSECADRNKGLVLPCKAVIFTFLRELPDTLTQIERERPDGHFVVIARDSDSTVESVLGVRGIHSAVKHLFTVHCMRETARITSMPFALRWADHVKGLSAVAAATARKHDNFVLLAHRLPKHLSDNHERHAAYADLQDRPWVTAIRADGERDPLSNTEYLTALRCHDYFVAASNDNGAERHAMWEALALGTIPICTQRQRRWAEMPIVVVDDWTDVTLSLCEEQIASARSKTMEKLSLAYWIEMVRQKAEDL